jgi:protein-L-isoaspartate(D-aspartate) O-methyltransferase
MLAVPREVFVPDDRREAAYVGENIDLGQGRVVLEARTLAKILDALDIQGDELVLDIGVGFGYSAAVIARMAEAVVAVEENQDWAEEAQTILSEQGADNVILHIGALSNGAPQHGPYDVICIQGAVEHLPDGMTDQLKDGGRMAVLYSEGALGVVRIGYKIDGKMNWRFAFNAGAPVLPGFERHAAFTL